MHQTTIRFAPDVWREIEQQARELRVSAAQYVRDATLMRMAGAARSTGTGSPGDPRGPRDAHGEAVHAESLDVLEGSEAVWAQARMARSRARSTREEAERLLYSRRERAR